MRQSILLIAIIIAVVIAGPRQQRKAPGEKIPPKPGVYIREFQCLVDPKINETTIKNDSKYREQIQKYLFPNSCGRARGVFIIDDHKEYEGKTYSCANFPPQWGIKTPGEFFNNPNNYKQHVEYLSLYLAGVFNTTAVKGPQTCDFYGFSRLFCGEKYENPWKKAPWFEKVGRKPLRGVNMGGVFVLEPWITPNFTQWKAGLDDQYTFSLKNPQALHELKQLWSTWYTAADFQEMKSIGLNSVRIPVGWWYFAKEAELDPKPYVVPEQDIYNLTHPITAIIKLCQASNLTVILDLHGAPESQNGLDNSGRRSENENPEVWGNDWFYNQNSQRQTTSINIVMAKYVVFLEKNNIDNVIAIELINEPWVFGDMSIVRDFYVHTIPQIRLIHKDLPIIIHDAFRHTEWGWLLNDWPFHNVFMDTHLYHAFNSDDIASSNPSCDKLKQTINENIACGYGSLLRYKTCVSLPTMTAEWSLAIDDCMGNIRGQDYSVQFHDYGQCQNLKARTGDKWWTDHINSFAAKQMYMFERELGWYFWTWKTGYGAEKDVCTPYWSFKDAVKAKYINNPITDEWIAPACNYFVEDGGKC